MFCKKVSSIFHHSVSIGVVRPGLRCVVSVTNIIKPFSVNNSPVSFNSAGYSIESWKKCFFKYISVDSTCTPALLSGANPNLKASISFMMPEPKKKEFQRLPKAVQPLHYKLELQPHLENFTFSGKEAVEVQVVKETENIVLNAAELEIQSVSFISGNKKITNCTWELSEEDELCTISFPSVIPVGRGELKISFTGTLNNKMRGFYRSKYLSPTGETRYAAVTQFESTDARRAFPCWDEPALKARFDITLIAPKDRIAISNMPVSSEETFPEDDSLRMVHFQTTPIMSTYLVAVVVGEYDYIEDRSADGVLVRVYTPQGKTEQGRFALEVATKVLPYYKDYFQIAYPLPKIDLITIADFSSGAMENWGLVTYAESALLVDPHNTSASSKQWVAIVVGHELAHQWFGNLVTMEWWTHLWLNEGYASFVEYLCVDHIFPEYDIWTQFVTGTYIDALKLDCLRNSHPIEVPVGHPSEVEEIFDSISYSKGACIVRMLHHYIGEKDFKKGMNIYLTKHKYKNTFTEDLWAALEEASGKPVGAVMCTWTKQMGFPLIKVKSRQEGTSRVLTLSQERFVPDGKLGSGDNMQWMVPLSVCSSHSPSSTVKQFVLETKSAEISLENIGPDDWVKLNPGTVGYYRTQYPPEMLAQMIPAIKSKTLPPLDRLGLLDDLFAITQAGKVSTVEVLRLLRSFMDEDDYTVWSCIHSILRRISSLLDYTDYKDLFMDYTRELLQTIFSKLGWEPKDEESHVVSMLRPMVIGRLGVSGDQAIIAEARRRFDAHVAGTNLMPADIRNAVYRTVLSVGDAATYEAILKLHSETELQEEKNRLTRSLGSMRSKDLLVRALQFSLTDALRPPDTVFLIASVASSKLGSDLAWQFFKDHSEELLNKYKPGFLLSALVKYVTEDFVTEERAQEVEAFFLEHPMAGTERTIQQSLENIRLSEAWLNRDRDAIKAFLLKQK